MRFVHIPRLAHQRDPPEELLSGGRRGKFSESTNSLGLFILVEFVRVLIIGIPLEPFLDGMSIESGRASPQQIRIEFVFLSIGINILYVRVVATHRGLKLLYQRKGGRQLNVRHGEQRIQV
jgi:hypothetical protein